MLLLLLVFPWTFGTRSSRSSSRTSVLACSGASISALSDSGLSPSTPLPCEGVDPLLDLILHPGERSGPLLVTGVDPGRCPTYRSLLTNQSRFSPVILLPDCSHSLSNRSDPFWELQPSTAAWTRALDLIITSLRSRWTLEMVVLVQDSNPRSLTLARELMERSRGRVTDFWTSKDGGRVREKIRNETVLQSVVLVLIWDEEETSAPPPPPGGGTVPLILRPSATVGRRKRMRSGRERDPDQGWMVLEVRDSFSEDSIGSNVTTEVSKEYAEVLEAASALSSWIRSSRTGTGDDFRFQTSGGGFGRLDAQGRRRLDFVLSDFEGGELVRVRDGTLTAGRDDWVQKVLAEVGLHAEGRLPVWLGTGLTAGLVAATLSIFLAAHRRRRRNRKSVLLKPEEICLEPPSVPGSTFLTQPRISIFEIKYSSKTLNQSDLDRLQEQDYTGIRQPVPTQDESHPENLLQSVGVASGGGGHARDPSDSSLQPNPSSQPPKVVTYKGEPVTLRPLPSDLVFCDNKLDHLRKVRNLRHRHLNCLLGVVFLSQHPPSLVWSSTSRGSLAEVLYGRDRSLILDWELKLQFLMDIAQGLIFLHKSWLGVHGHVSSENCLVDRRWTLRLADFGMLPLDLPIEEDSASVLWSAPELLTPGQIPRPTPSCDVFSFAIIVQEVSLRNRPYGGIQSKEVFEGLCCESVLGSFRPSVSANCAPPALLLLMRQCWAQDPRERPLATRVAKDLEGIMRTGRWRRHFSEVPYPNPATGSSSIGRERLLELEDERDQTTRLLDSMLPVYVDRSVSRSLKAGIPVVPEKFSDVTVCFSDIVGFTTISAYSEPLEIVTLLNDLYSAFDAVIDNHNVYKVETIGDAYMVAGGLPERISDHAEQVCSMALELLHTSAKFKIRHLPGVPLRLRTGIHSDPLVAGVVGTTMPRYCLFGDTVNIASRMESTSRGNRIQVSGSTERKLRETGGYNLLSRGAIDLKGRGTQMCFWLVGKRGFDLSIPSLESSESSENHGLSDESVFKIMGRVKKSEAMFMPRLSPSSMMEEDEPGPPSGGPTSDFSSLAVVDCGNTLTLPS